MKRTFAKPPLILTSKQTQVALDPLVKCGVTGGAIYDGLIAVTARTHDATLVSLDQRASMTYARLGVAVIDPRLQQRL